MSIVIENSTAESVYEVIERELAPGEIERLTELFNRRFMREPNFSSEWSEEDLANFSKASAAQIAEDQGKAA